MIFDPLSIPNWTITSTNVGQFQSKHDLVQVKHDIMADTHILQMELCLPSNSTSTDGHIWIACRTGPQIWTLPFGRITARSQCTFADLLAFESPFWAISSTGFLVSLKWPPSWRRKEFLTNPLSEVWRKGDLWWLYSEKTLCSNLCLS